VSRRAAPADPNQLGLFELSKPAVPGASGMGTNESAAASGVKPASVADPFVPECVPIDRVLVPAVFRHPKADREIRLNEHIVAYSLRRARRRSIGFIVGTEGLSVNAPKWVSIRDIELALQEKARWILRKLAEQQERVERLHAARVDWRDGTSIPFLGETVIVVLDPRAGLTERGAVLNSDALSLPGVPRLTLHVGLPHTAQPEQIRDVVQSWLQRQARRVFEERCVHFAQQLRVRYKRLSLSSAQTRWGSANADGSIRLNWRLIHFAMSSIDYVVAHELAHLREMNHSPRFWDIVRSVVPDYEKARGSLKDGLVPLLD
jgi:predicted metal-dependent hydrolase